MKVVTLFILLFIVVENLASGELSNERLDWIEALLKEQTQRIKNLERKVNVQNSEISLLKKAERTCRGEISLLKRAERTFRGDLSFLKEVIATKWGKITKNKPEVTLGKTEEEMTKSLLEEMAIDKSEEMTKDKSSDGLGISKIQTSDVEPVLQKRLLLGVTQPPTTEKTIAFYAYMSKHELKPGPHHTLIFDTVKTNINGGDRGYSGNTGTFTVPIDGVYVFTYSIRSVGSNYGPFEIVKNTNVEGVSYMNEHQSGNQDHLTGTVVIAANTGDEVYVRTHATYVRLGDILSDDNGKSSFAGWRIGKY